MWGPYMTIVADEAEFAAAAERAKMHTYRRTCPLLASSPGKLEHIGSCVLVRAGLRTLAVTAAHAVDVIRRLHAVPALAAAGDAPAAVTVLPFEFAESVAPRGDRLRDRVDVAAIPVPEDVNVEDSGHAVTDLSDIDVQYEPAPGDVVGVQGFPVEHGRQYDAGGLPGVRVESTYFYTSASADLPRKVRPKNGAKAPSFSVRFDRDPPMRVGLVGKAPRPRGLSGCGAWLLGRTDPTSGLWTPLGTPRLIGVIQEWHHSDRALVVTRADSLAPCIYLCPGARDAALRAFPDLSTMRPVDS
ncbi:MAG: hypothetical protein HMLKMBBP_00092 [Planctomycetes bacterium]|nr:hypothetical protein [Planctomycetota bacterium]